MLDHDHDPPRVVRMAGWRVCLRCESPFWSEDVVRLRICPRCKGQTYEKPLRG